MKNKLLIYIITLLLSNLILYTQELPDYFLADGEKARENKGFICSHQTGFKHRVQLLDNSTGESAIVWRPYDVLHYDLYMDWKNVLLAEGFEGEDRHYRGTNVITIKIDSANTNEIAYTEVQVPTIIFNIGKANYPEIPNAIIKTL